MVKVVGQNSKEKTRVLHLLSYFLLLQGYSLRIHQKRKSFYEIADLYVENV